MAVTADRSAHAPGDALELPAWYPGWARELAELYFSGTTCLFVLHGNVHDLIRQGDGPNAAYGSLPRFLATQLFGQWDLVLRHDLGQGLRLFAGADADRLRKMAALASARIGDPKSWPRDPDAILALLDQLIRDLLMDDDQSRQLRLGVIFEYAQFLVPSAELAQMAGPQGTRLVRLLSWAQNPYIKRHNVAFCLLCDHLAEINERLVASSHVATLFGGGLEDGGGHGARP